VILDVIFSTSVLHSTLDNLLAVIGSPKYVIGRCPSENPIKSMHSFLTAGLVPPNTIWDFDMLALSPVHVVKRWKASIRSLNDVREALQKMTKSSANMRCVIPNFLQ